METIKDTNMTDSVGRFLASLTLGEPQVHKNLEVYPAFSRIAENDGYLILDEAIPTKKFTITEVSEGGTVPELKVSNGLDADVVILEGEQLVGAKQNRIVNTTIVIGKGKAVVIPVSCVERGRWSYRSREFHASDAPLYMDLRSKKSRAVSRNLKEFSSYSADQGEVWGNIAAKSARMSVDSDTEAMQDIYEARQKEMAAYEKAFTAERAQIGFVALINGKVAGCDLFGFHSIFPKVYKKLLRGYILDALDHGRDAGAAAVGRGRGSQDASSRDRSGGTDRKQSEAPKHGRREVERFFETMRTIKKDAYRSVGDGVDVRFEGRPANGFAVVNKGAIVHMAAFGE
jgi:hypothetical protein